MSPQLIFLFFLSLQVQIDDKCRRERETRINGFRIDLSSLCVTSTTTQPQITVRNTDARNPSSRIGRNGLIMDSQGNSIPPLSPVSSNNSSNSEMDSHDKPIPMTPAG